MQAQGIAVKSLGALGIPSADKRYDLRGSVHMCTGPMPVTRYYISSVRHKGCLPNRL